MKRPSRAVVLGVCGIVAVLAIVFVSAYGASSAKGRLSMLRSQHEELLSLRVEFLAVRKRVEAFESRARLTSVKGIPQAVDEVLGSMGLKDRMKSLKRLQAEAGEDKAELNLQDVDMNETVNILYAFNNAPMPLVIRKVELKTSFQNPGRLNMTMTLSLVKV